MFFLRYFFTLCSFFLNVVHQCFPHILFQLKKHFANGMHVCELTLDPNSNYILYPHHFCSNSPSWGLTLIHNFFTHGVSSTIHNLEFYSHVYVQPWECPLNNGISRLFPEFFKLTAVVARQRQTKTTTQSWRFGWMEYLEQQ